MKIPMKAVALLLGAWTLGTTAPAEMFKDGETVVFLGDSITSGGSYQTLISDYKTNMATPVSRIGAEAGDPELFFITPSPIERDLNQEILSVRGLPAGTHDLKIDGAVVGRYSAKDLERGINLAFNEATPQFKRAKTVARFNAQRRDADPQACRLMNTRRWMQSQYGIDPDDPAAVQAHYDSSKDKTEYSAAAALTHIKKWSQYGGVRRQVTERENEALASRRPHPHAHEICASR